MFSSSLFGDKHTKSEGMTEYVIIRPIENVNIWAKTHGDPS